MIWKIEQRKGIHFFPLQTEAGPAPGEQQAFSNVSAGLQAGSHGGRHGSRSLQAGVWPVTLICFSLLDRAMGSP